MNIMRASEQPTRRGPADYFTGAVWIDDISPGLPGAALRALRVSFEPGARTAWHTHPFGQLLHIVSGVARVQRADGEVVELRAGDSVWFEPGERHWHGAAPGNTMVHLAIQPADADGNTATWQEHVSDADYHGHARG